MCREERFRRGFSSGVVRLTDVLCKFGQTRVEFYEGCSDHPF